jgi:dTDP-4-dehydrorhamnose 3,5-epimerase
MEVINTPLKDAKVINLKSFHDNRGYFVEKYNKNKLSDLGFNVDFIQDNLSYSKQNVIRGLHMQLDKPQGKLVSVAFGTIKDVIVDLRSNSPTFKQTFSVILSAEKSNMLWVPEGFLHGFSVLSEEGAIVTYKVNNPYNPAGEKGVIYNDPTLAIDWEVDEPIVSEKDTKLPLLEELLGVAL